MTRIREDGRVEFRFFRPQATRIGIAGDFNSWNGSAMWMQPAGNGWWTATAALAPGEYRFRYIADGNWFTDYAAHGVESTPAGWNAVLVVPKRRERTPDRVEELCVAG